MSDILVICKKTCTTCRKAVALLEELGVTFTYREYTKEPLSADELRDVLGKLGLAPSSLLRSREMKKVGLEGDEGDDALIEAMAANPNLIQRPIYVKGDEARIGRPPETVKELL